MTFFYFIQCFLPARPGLPYLAVGMPSGGGLNHGNTHVPLRLGTNAVVPFGPRCLLLLSSSSSRPWGILGRSIISPASVWTSVKWADGRPSCLRPSIQCSSGLYPKAVLRVLPYTRSSERKPATWDIVSHSCSWINHDQEEDGTPDVGLLREPGVLPVSWAFAISPTTLLQTTSSSSPWSQPSTCLQEASSRWFLFERLCFLFLCLDPGPISSS